jgi:large subunit ribosomal protein L25
MEERLRAYVALRFKGTSLAVKDFNAILVHNIEQLHVECLPADLPEYVEVDISVLKNPGDGIRVGDLSVADNVDVLDDADMMVAVASASKIEEALSELEEGAAEEGALVGEGEGDEPELSVERGKKDEDEE